MATDGLDIWIELDDDTPRYESGETVTGTVHVEVDEERQCDGLKVGLRRRVYGQGTPARETLAPQNLFDGQWEEGRHYTYRFEMSVPPGPHTYHGHYLKIDWEVRAGPIPAGLGPRYWRPGNCYWC